MSYLVTARKWRPQSFEEVIGQAHVCRTLQNAILSRRIAHAYLFTGTRGVGKTTTARILAKALNCQEGPTPQPCNHCLFCREITIGSSVDVLEIDGASNRGIDEIRELRDSMRYAPAKGRYKVYIIDEVHMLTKEAFNALLKTLEEPPLHVVFILATTEPNKIPITILSRCQRFDLRPLPLTEILARLELIARQEGMRLPSEVLSQIARKARGSMRDAQSLLDQVVAFAEGGEVGSDLLVAVLGRVDREWLFALTEAILGKDASEVLRRFQEFSNEPYDLRDLYRDLLEHLRHLIVLKVSQEPLKLIDLPPAEVERMRQQGQRVGLEELQLLFALLAQVEGEMRFSSHPHLILEMALVRMTAVRSVRPVEEAIERLEEMERRLSAGKGGPRGSLAEGSGGEGAQRPRSAATPSEPAIREVPAIQWTGESRPREEPSRERPPAASRPLETASTPPEVEGPEGPPEADGQVWQAIRGHLERKEGVLASLLLQHLSFKALSQEKLVLELEADSSFVLSYLQNRDTLKLVEELARQVTGRTLQVELLGSPAQGTGLNRRAEGSLPRPAGGGEPGAEPDGFPLEGWPKEGAKASGPAGRVEVEEIVREAQEIFGGKVYPQGSWPKAFPLLPEPAGEAEGLSGLEREDG